MTEAILVALAEWSLRATILAVVVGAVLWICRVRNAHVRLTVWTAVLAGVILMPAVTLLMQPIPFWFISDPHPMSTAVFSEGSPAASQETGYVPAVSPVRRVSWTDIVVGVWLTVAFGMIGRVALGFVMARRLLRGSVAVDSGTRESRALHVPVTVGLNRPIILLPSDWREWEPEKLQAVLAHERSHVMRRDPLRQLVASVFRSVAWFHPLAWWLRVHLMELSELASDDVAVSVSGDRVTYAEILLGFIEQARGRARVEGVAMATAKTRARRLERILSRDHQPSRPLSLRIALGLTALLVPLLYTVGAIRPQKLEAQSLELTRPPVAAAPQAIQAARPAATPVCGGSARYMKWLEEDVTYIITDVDKRYFLSLQTEQKCDEFISQFWQVRGEDAKKEHYRRIAYSNARFPSNRPGWRTDRGRIYITFGPPDEIESHPSGSVNRPAEQGGGVTSTYPYEIWLYKYIEGVGEDVQVEFIDSKRNGDYSQSTIRERNAVALLQRRGQEPKMLRVQMLLLNPHVTMDGVNLGSADVPTLSGHTIYVARRGVGAIHLGLDTANDPSFAAIGVAQGRRIQVQIAGHTLVIDCSAEVAPGGTATVYGRFDSSYRTEAQLELGVGK